MLARYEWMNEHERIMIIFNALFSMYLCIAAAADAVVVGIFSQFPKLNFI